MIFGIRLKANPTAYQKLILSQWMGCARFTWNAKCDEERYYSNFARKYYPIGTYAPIDQTTAQFKNKELSPFLYQCPSQILRNSAVNWYQTYQKFMKKQCGKPKRKPKTDKGSIHLTRELFQFKKEKDGVMHLWIGTKKYPLGILSFKSHRKFHLPNSLYIKKERGQYYISFCYQKEVDQTVSSNIEHLAYLKETDKNYLNTIVVGIDRGVVVPLQAGEQAFDFTNNQKKNKNKAKHYIKRLQRKLSKQQKSSKRRCKTKHRIAKYHAKCLHIRKDFCHQTSRALVNSPVKVFVFEDLKTANMTKAPKPKKNIHDKFIANGAKQKAGLNKAILDKGWHQLETFTKYKAEAVGKAVFKISAAYTSQECADCGHIHPDNRRSQALFQCGSCGHIDKADRNASLVIKKKAINMILDTGTVLSDKGVLTFSDTGRRAGGKSNQRTRLLASGDEPSKTKRSVATKVAA